MALTKAVAEVDAFAEVAAATTREGAEVDVSACYEATLHIDVCLAEAAAESIGATIFVLISSNTSGDEDWHLLTTLAGPTGTAFKVDIAADEAAGQTVISVTNPTTANLDHPGKFLFIENTATAANSEIVFQVSNEGDAGDTITIADGLTNAQAAADGDIWDVDSATVSAVAQFTVPLPQTTVRAKILYDNHNSSGVDVFTRCRVSKVTAL